MRYLTAIYLGINAWTDWKTKEIDIRYTLFFILLVCILKLCRGEIIYWSGMVPGIFFFGVSLWKKSSLGRGDGIVIGALGWVMGIEKVWNILMNGFLLAGAAGILLWLRERKKEIEMPFVPFLMAGYLMEEYGKWFT